MELELAHAKTETFMEENTVIYEVTLVGEFTEGEYLDLLKNMKSATLRVATK